MNENLVYWVWATLCFSPGNRRMQAVLEEMDPKTLYERRQDPAFPGLNAGDLAHLKSISLVQAERVLENCQRLGVQVITMGDEEYPKRLFTADAPPPVLYYQGDLRDLDQSLTIGIVGTRSARDYYLRCTGNISYQLAQAGVVIVSGCAKGCDQYAHLGAVKAKGRTVGVLACGFGINYPRETEGLRQEMLQMGGALISELPPFTKNEKGYFNIRNRLIAGLSEGVLVTQVPLRSGSLLTANHAVDQGKELFCLPPDNICDSSCMGAAVLIRDGARVIFSARDILEDYLERFRRMLDGEMVPEEDMLLQGGGERHKRPAAGKALPAKEALPLPDDLSAEQKTVLDLLTDGPAHVEDLLARTEMAPYELLAVLTELELRELCRALSGQRYERA